MVIFVSFAVWREGVVKVSSWKRQKTLLWRENILAIYNHW